jgi:fructose-1,6-bisphosphatase
MPMTSGIPRNLTTVAQHIIEQQRNHPTATGQFSWLLSGITLATKIIESYVRRAGLADVLGETGDANVQGELVQKLDMLANDTIKRCLGYRGNIGILVSEEEDEPRIIKNAGADGRYVVLFDPLDGSSNIDVNVSIGTIFSVLQKRDDVWPSDGPDKHILQPGLKQVAAGYVVYGSSTVLAYTTGDGVHMFTLNPNIGAFVLHQERVTMPASGKTYSVNEAYYGIVFPKAFSVISTGPSRRITRCATSARWWRTSIARCCVVGFSSIRRPRNRRRASCACFMKPTPWLFLPSRPVAPRATAAAASWKSNPRASTSAPR